MNEAAHPGEHLSTRAKMLVIGATLLGLFVSAMDQTVVSTALPRIVSDLGGFEKFSWVFTSYMLTSTVTAPIWGKLSDIYGRKLFQILGVSIFVVTSVMTGAAQTMDQLIVFRALQGIGSGMIMASSFTVIADLFPPEERGRWQGLLAAVFGLSSIVGPTVGGTLTDNASWRWAFYINVPIGLVALPVLWKALPVIKHGRQGRIDYLGSATLAAAVTPLLLAFVWAGDTYSWSSVQVIGLFAASLAMTLAFLYVEHKAEDPIIPLHLFRSPTYNIVSFITLLTGMAMFGTMVYVPLFVQGVIGASATNSGIVTAPMMIGLIVASVLSGQMVSRTGKYKAISLLGLLVMGGGLYLLSSMGAGTTRWTATAWMIVLGFGVGAVMPTMNVVAQNSVPMRLLGVVTSNLTFYRSIGGTIGVAIMGTIVTTQLAGNLPEIDLRGQQLPPPVLERLEDPQTLVNPDIEESVRAQFLTLDDGAALFDTARENLRLALAESLEWTFLLGVILTAVAFVVLLGLRESPLRRLARGEATTGGEPGQLPSGARAAEAASVEPSTFL
jgi:EmrB/QacA subfamily drug resistance transporter